MIMRQWRQYLRWSDQWNPSNKVYLLSKFDVFSFSMTGDIDFQIGHSVNFEQFQIDSHLDDSGQVKLTLLLNFYQLSLDKTCPIT